MLISITEKCRMGCSHCMDDAKADNEDFMDEDTFRKAITFNFKYDPSITITGGEPTEHPRFWEYMQILADCMDKNNICSITTNGMNLSNDDIDKIMELHKSKGTFAWQVSSIPPYYPIKVNLTKRVFHSPGFCIADKLEKLEPRGRAANHKDWNFNCKAPQCFNLRSIIRSTNDFGLTIKMLRSSGKFCTPQISFDGCIKVGESTLCPAVAHISDSESEIVNKLCQFKCNGCREILSKLPVMYRNAIGEE